MKKVATRIHWTGPKRKFERASVLDTGRTCKVCPNPILVTTTKTLKARDEKEYCSRRCARAGIRDAKLRRYSNFNVPKKS